MGECFQAWLLELGNPAVVNFLERHRIKEMQLLKAMPHGGDPVRRHQHVEVLRHALPRHVQLRLPAYG